MSSPNAAPPSLLKKKKILLCCSVCISRKGKGMIIIEPRSLVEDPGFEDLRCGENMRLLWLRERERVVFNASAA